MPFIVGSPRSGTTLLRLMLDAHSDLAIPPETSFLPAVFASRTGYKNAKEDFFRLITNFPPDAPNWQDFEISTEEFHSTLSGICPFTASQGLRCFYKIYAKRFGKTRVGDKTPMYCRHMSEIETLLPEAAFIHIIRDGRDASLSLRPLWFAPGTDVPVLAAYWRDNVQAARSSGTNCHRYLEVRYEHLLLDPETTLREICRFLDLPFEPAMLEFHGRSPMRLMEHKERVRTDGHVVVSRERRRQQQWRTTQPVDISRIGVWRHELSVEECEQFDYVAGSLLRELGYADSTATHRS
jgi:Sulfotransferase family